LTRPFGEDDATNTQLKNISPARMPTRDHAPGGTNRATPLLALVVFVLLACLHTWPLSTNPAHLSRTDNGDALLNMWTIGWVAHQLPRNPRHLFDANIFYPEPLTLAYSESMIVQGILALPVFAAGGSAVLAYNVVLLAGFALTGWAFCMLLHRWTGSWAAGYTAGSLAAFNPHVFLRLPHLQTFHVEFIALILFVLDRHIVSRRARDAAWLGVAVALQGLTSLYLLVFTTWMLFFAAAARAREWLGRGALRAIGRFALAGTTAAIIMGPYLFAYYRLHRLHGFERTITHAELGAATWQNYLSTVSRFHYNLWSHRFVNAGIPAFPGGAALALIVLVLLWPETRRDRRVHMCLAAAVGCAIMSVLPGWRIFPMVYPLIPGIRAIRVVARVEQIVLLMTAVVAGFGVDGLRRRMATMRAWPAVAIAIVALVNLEARHAPLRLRTFTEIPPIYDVLASARGAVIIELPFHPPDVFFANADYMLNSTRHWQPMLNGYSGYQPPSYAETFNAVQGFPNQAALTTLHDRGVTHVVVHSEGFRGAFGIERYESLAETGALTLVAEDGDIRIYRLR
jgi:hypothetical protein